MKAETAGPLAAILVLCLSAGTAFGANFTHYVLALSWSASWCALEGDDRDAAQCDPRHDFAFTLHGLWPQGERGWPEFCRTRERDPTRHETAAMADIMGSAGLAWHEWKKHGRCSGLSSEAYYALSRRAYEAIRQPEVLRELDRAVRIDPDVIEEAFIEANPGLDPADIAVTCDDGLIREVRICLTPALAPRACTPDVRSCRAESAMLPPVR